MSRLLFLSHSGIDTEAAKALKARILASPAAQEHGLSVWFDKDDLHAGEPWQRQLEEAIGRSHAFAVYVGSKGVVNWVEAEVRLALSRAIEEPDYRFVPILAGTAPNPESLPGFARQFHGVLDVEARPDQFDNLMRAVLGGAEAGRLQLETEPFFGLQAIDESRSHLFFGREDETDALVTLVHQTPLVLVIGDSGSGKSSLVRAGLVPRFRGGALALPDGARSEDTIWHVVTTQPRNQPFRQLSDAVDEAAKGLGLPLDDRGTLADWATSGEIDKVRRGLRCDLPPERVQVLLVVDQFEELLTITPPELRGPFIDLLLDLSDPADGRHRVVLTMRHDYHNLCSAFERLRGRLDADDRRARFQLGRVSDEGLRRIVTKPLRLAAVEPADREALAVEVLRDVGERPGDLALVQMALTEAWQARERHGGDLLRAYVDVGRVEGALAQAAERVWTQVLDGAERALLETILLRLVRLGDTGGATRRVAIREEFDDARWSLIQKLASEDGKRLILLRGSTEHPTVEIAHEALVTAWPYFQNLLQETVDEKRVLDTLIPRAQAWAAEEVQEERGKRLATGADLEFFAALAGRHAAWLSDDERGFIEASTVADDKRRRRERWMTRALQGIAATLLVAFAFAGWMWWLAQEERDKAIAAEKTARASESRALGRQLAAQALVDLPVWPERSLLWALESLDATVRTDGSPLPAAQESLRQIVALTGGVPLRVRSWVDYAAVSHDGKWILTVDRSKQIRIWDSSNPHASTQQLTETGRVATFDPLGRWVAIGRSDGTVRLWSLDRPMEEATIVGHHEGLVLCAAFTRDGKWLATGGKDGTVRLWDLRDTRARPIVLKGDKTGVSDISLSPEGKWLAAASRTTSTVRLWDLDNPQVNPKELLHGSGVLALAFGYGERKMLAISGYDSTVRIWDLEGLSEGPVKLSGHQGSVWTVAFSPDAKWLATGSDDHTARLWNLSGAVPEAVVLSGHQNRVRSLDFSPDGRWLATGSADKSVRLWHMANPTKTRLVLRGHEGFVQTASFSPDSKMLITGGTDSTSRLWNLTDLRKLPLVSRHKGLSFAVALSPGGRHATASGSYGAVRLWNLNDPGGDAIVLADATGRTTATAFSVAFSVDGEWLATGARNGTVRLWNLRRLKAGPEVFRAHQKSVSSIAFSRNKEWLATGSDDGTVRVWDFSVSPPKVVSRLPHGDEHVSAVAFSPNSLLLATGSSLSNPGPEPKVRIWDLTPERPVVLQSIRRASVNALAFSEDGQFLAVGEHNGTVLVRDISEGAQEPVVPPGHENYVNALAFSANGRWLATASEDKTVRLWDLESRESIALRGHDRPVKDVVFGTDGVSLITLAGELDSYSVRFWPVKLEDVVEVACSTARRNISAYELEKLPEGLARRATCP